MLDFQIFGSKQKSGQACRFILKNLSDEGANPSISTPSSAWMAIHRNIPDYKRDYAKNTFLYKQTFINNQIRAKEVRVIDETDKQVGLMSLENALKAAQEKGLDLIQITEKADPPVCKIGDFGKFLYRQKKKEKQAKPKGGETKGVRLGFGISDHDLAFRAQQAHNFLKEGNKVRVEMILRGREKALGNFAREKMVKFLETVDKLAPCKVDRELKRDPRGFSIIISKG